jgi:hypothetical protein
MGTSLPNIRISPWAGAIAASSTDKPVRGGPQHRRAEPCGTPRLVPALARSRSRTLRQSPGCPPRSRSWGTRPSRGGIADRDRVSSGQHTGRVYARWHPVRHEARDAHQVLWTTWCFRRGSGSTPSPARSRHKAEKPVLPRPTAGRCDQGWFAAWYCSSVTGSSQVVPSPSPVPSNIARWHIMLPPCCRASAPRRAVVSTVLARSAGSDGGAAVGVGCRCQPRSA